MRIACRMGDETGERHVSLHSPGGLALAGRQGEVPATRRLAPGEENPMTHAHTALDLEDFDRVRRMSPSGANDRIDARTDTAIAAAEVGGRAAIERRLTELAQEWDIDRVLMTNFAIVVFAQLLAARRDRRWLWGPLIQTPLLLMHATIGWCPPSLWFRPLGFRTRFEIQAEREALLRRLGQLPAHAG